jgi:hypothetical protein
MNTFNNLAVANITNSNTEEQMQCLASLGIVYPTVSSGDAARLAKIGKAGVLASLKSCAARHLQANTERLQTITTLIERLQKLNPGVLDGGLPLKTALIECAWLVYAKVEMHGIDNAHYNESSIPCDDRDTTSSKRGYGLLYSQANRKVKRTLPDSKLAPADQWLALELYELFK